MLVAGIVAVLLIVALFFSMLSSRPREDDLRGDTTQPE
jgi:hypothetical protein